MKHTRFESDPILKLIGRIRKEVDFSGLDLTDVPATLLATAVNRMEWVAGRAVDGRPHGTADSRHLDSSRGQLPLALPRPQMW